MKKLFGDIKITWKFLIIFSVILGIGVGILNRIPILNNTSFQDIAIYLEMWIILAIFIIVNSRSSKEAILKNFIFFLISQPLIYLTEIIIDVVNDKGTFIELCIQFFKNYYIGSGWFLLTILTIPGSFIAYQVKKKNLLSALILSVATGYLAYAGFTGIYNVITVNFPYHLINSMICIFMCYYLIYILLDKKRDKIIAIVISTICGIIGIVTVFINNSKPMIINDFIDFPEDIELVSVSVDDENIATAMISDNGYSVEVNSSTDIGKTLLTVVDKDGNNYKYEIISNSREFLINKK